MTGTGLSLIGQSLTFERENVMLVVKVELYSAISGEKTELARMVIDNVGGTPHLGDYRAQTMRGRDGETLEKSMRDILHGRSKPVKEGRILKHPRLREHVWNLVAKALNSMSYGR